MNYKALLNDNKGNRIHLDKMQIKLTRNICEKSPLTSIPHIMQNQKGDEADEMISIMALCMSIIRYRTICHPFNGISFYAVCLPHKLQSNSTPTQPEAMLSRRSHKLQTEARILTIPPSLCCPRGRSSQKLNTKHWLTLPHCNMQIRVSPFSNCFVCSVTHSDIYPPPQFGFIL